MERVLIAGGGTGGHLYPGLAVAAIIKRKHRDADVRFLGTARGLEADVVPKEGYPLELVSVRGMPRRSKLSLVPWGVSFVKSLFECRRLFQSWRPDVILGTGGYASAPAVAVGRMMGIPVVLQEQNSVPGMVTRRLSRYANEVHLNFPGARRFLSRRDHLRLTGNPLRPGIIEGNRRRALEEFSLEERRRTVLVMGGSHGAQTINRAVVDAAGMLPKDLPVQFLVQSGAADVETVTAGLGSSPFPATVRAFVEKMNDAYAVADVVVGRAGAMSLSEIAACGLPAVLVPYPYATDDHQTRNAQEIVDRGAAVMIPDAECTGDRLAKELERLVSNPNRLRRMATLSRGSARYGGADRLADALIAYGAQPDIVEEQAVDDASTESSSPMEDIREQMRAANEKRKTPPRSKKSKRGGRPSSKSSSEPSPKRGGRRRRGRGPSKKTTNGAGSSATTSRD